MSIFPVRRWLGIDGVDLAIQAGITLCTGIVLASGVHSHGEIPFFSVVTASLGVLALRRAIARRRGDMDPRMQVSGSYALELEQRVADLEATQQRMYELEERLDFAERLLAQQRQPERLP